VNLYLRLLSAGVLPRLHDPPTLVIMGLYSATAIITVKIRNALLLRKTGKLNPSTVSHHYVPRRYGAFQMSVYPNSNGLLQSPKSCHRHIDGLESLILRVRICTLHDRARHDTRHNVRLGKEIFALSPLYLIALCLPIPPPHYKTSQRV
jgi:hypothetical protein